jgi:hypothetical protein
MMVMNALGSYFRGRLHDAAPPGGDGEVDGEPDAGGGAALEEVPAIQLGGHG